MIRLFKGIIPGVLQASYQAWTNILLAHRTAGTTPTATEKARYRHVDIKQALVNETRGKCAYCESKLRHIAYGDVEHIVPKSTSIEKTFDWSNLTLACDVCNTNKDDHFGNHDDLVDPYAVEPSTHLNFIGAMVLPMPGSGPGHITVSTLRLNRIDLVERRAERLEQLCRLLHLMVEVLDENRRDVIRRDLEREYTEDKEYSAMSKGYICAEFARIQAVTQTVAN